MLIDNRSLSKLSQGITSEITGEGGSIAPQNERTLASEKDFLDYYHLSIDWQDLAGYFRRLETNGTPINLGTYVGAAQVREAVLGDVNRAPTPAELQQMESLVATAMQQGALGVSTALIYPPGHYATTEELIALAKVASQYGGLYATHMRSEGQSEMAAIDEAIRIGREAQLPVEIFHLKVSGKTRWGGMPQVIAKLQAARDSGLDIAADMYPYTAGGTALASSLPPWMADGGMEKLLARLQDPATRRRIVAEMAQDHDDWENLYLDCGGGSGVMISAVVNPALKKYDGMTVAEMAKAENKPEMDALFDFILADKGQTDALYFMANEKDLQYGLKQAWTSVGLDAGETSLDGPLFEAHTHPRAWGSMPRFLGHYARDLQLLDLSQAIRKITSLPAQREHLTGRGLLKSGFYADVTIFDPAAIIDRATYADPNQVAKGVKYVLVNGQLEWEDGKLTGATAGRVLRGNQLRAEELHHLVAGSIHVHLHGMPGLSRLASLDGSQNLRVADPSGDSLGTERIEARHIAEGQVELPQHPLIARQLTQPLMKGLVGNQNLLQAGCGVFLRRQNRRQVLYLIVARGLRHLFRRVAFQQLAVVVEVHDVAHRDGRHHEALPANPGQPMVLHQASAGFAHRGAAGSASLGEIGFREEFSGRKLGRNQPIAQDAVDTLYFSQLVSLGSGWFRQSQVTNVYPQRILPGCVIIVGGVVAYGGHPAVQAVFYAPGFAGFRGSGLRGPRAGTSQACRCPSGAGSPSRYLHDLFVGDAGPGVSGYGRRPAVGHQQYDGERG